MMLTDMPIGERLNLTGSANSLEAKNSLILIGDALERLRELPDNSIHLIFTGPPYFGLREYGIDAGRNKCATSEFGNTRGLTPEGFVDRLLEFLEEAHRVLHPNGTICILLADTRCRGSRKTQPHHAGGFQTEEDPKEGKHLGYSASADLGDHPTLQDQDLCLVTDRVSTTMQDTGVWRLRNTIVWAKLVTDLNNGYLTTGSAAGDGGGKRPRAGSERIFVFNKQVPFYANTPAMQVPNGKGDTRYMSDVWLCDPSSRSYKVGDVKHTAVAPVMLPRTAVRLYTSPHGACASCDDFWESENDGSPKAQCDCGSYHRRPCKILDFFAGMGTTLEAALLENQQAIGIELYSEFAALTHKRLVSKDICNTNMVAPTKTQDHTQIDFSMLGG